LHHVTVMVIRARKVKMLVSVLWEIDDYLRVLR
jgi:hypothetical protein